MKTTSIGGKGDTREVAVSVGMVLLWLRVLVVAALLIGAAHAQTLVTQPTTTTLWADSQDTTLPLNFILGLASTTQGTCNSSSNAITCNHVADKRQPGRKRTPSEIKKLGVELRR